MIERKLLMLQNGKLPYDGKDSFLETPYEEWKELAIRNVKKHGYTGLVAMIRYYVISANYLKNKYEQAKTKVKSLSKKNLSVEEKIEVNGFLKMITEYKQKIRDIKDRVKEEENL
ncbi:hypothetical protein HY311_01475 [Candidatus Nomurabacteria bacterium]|nr:hypothetical protein [Candidatus Nomurabacteria bacterium]